MSDWEQPETILERVLDDAGYDCLQPWRSGVIRAVLEAGFYLPSQYQAPRAEVAAISAKALREAADRYVNSEGGTKTRPVARSWLRREADRIEAAK